MKTKEEKQTHTENKINQNKPVNKKEENKDQVKTMKGPSASPVFIIPPGVVFLT